MIPSESISTVMIPSESISTVDPIHQFASHISKCITTKNLKFGKLLHSHLIKTAFTFNVFLANRLIDMYAKCDSIESAQKVFDDHPMKNTHSWNTLISAYCKIGVLHEAHHLFDKMPEPNLVSYNSMISGLTHHGSYKESIEVFKRMQQSGCNNLLIDEFTLVSVVGTCGCLSALTLLRQVHGVAVMIGLEMNIITYNALVDAYGKCGDPDTSYNVFIRMLERDVVSWTSMVVAYTRASRLEDACCVFDQMPDKNAVSWTALIAGFAQNGRGIEALSIFKKMQGEVISPSAYTFVGILSACADLALIERGKQIHGHVLRRSSSIIELCNVFVINALIDMYCKCGDMRSARTLFDGMPKKDIVSWNSILTGFAQNGHWDESFNVFKRMKEVGIRPNHVTFLGVLSACSHTGLVSEGLRLLDLMEDYGLKPRCEHYAILIDLLGRNNKLKEARELVKSAPNGLDHIGIWGALLGACRVHGNLDLALKAAEVLLELEPENASRYVMLSNIYAAANRWEDAQGMRKLIEERGLRKEVAYSWIEVRNTRHEFAAKDRFHCQIEEIYEVINNLVGQMNEVGYRYTPHYNSFPLEDEGIS